MALYSLDTQEGVIANLRNVLSAIQVSKEGDRKDVKDYNALSNKIAALQDSFRRALERDNLNLIAADLSTLISDNLLVYYLAAVKNMALLSSAIHYFRRCRFFDGQSCSQFVCDCVCDCVCNDCGGYCFHCGSYCNDCADCDCDCDCDSCGDCDCDSCGDYCDCFGGCSDCVACDSCDCFCDCDSECDCVGCDF